MVGGGKIPERAQKEIPAVAYKLHYTQEVNMRLFKKKQKPATTELNCPVAGCPFTCSDPVTLKRHTDWKHPELTEQREGKAEELK